eukprot:TRINITY_DN4660_c0_g1_i11.p1 TRINITY_DN4660_c0_g1~~TRINITY_DN4660_c0_g1_i11.p1  ORF type:complete len:363 (+),score=56.65 TRINITY_DN4660_c0_g1_i11:28-1116(+)
MYQNPLELDTVVRRVCYFLDGLEVLEFVRPVCKGWKHVAEDQQYWQAILTLTKPRKIPPTEQSVGAKADTDTDNGQNDTNDTTQKNNENLVQDQGDGSNSKTLDYNNLGVDQLNRFVDVLQICKEDLVDDLPGCMSRLAPWYRTLGGPFSFEDTIYNVLWDGVFQSQLHTKLISQNWCEIVLSRIWLDVLNSVGNQYKVNMGLDCSGREWAELVYKLDLKVAHRKWNNIQLDLNKMALVAIIGVQHHKHEAEVKAFLVSGNTPVPLRRSEAESFPGTRDFKSRAETEVIKAKDSTLSMIVLAIKPDHQLRVNLGIRGRSNVPNQKGPTVLFAGLRILPAAIPELLRENKEALEDNWHVCLAW